MLRSRRFQRKHIAWNDSLFKKNPVSQKICAYTEDGILVYNIIVRNLPLDATVQSVSEYFGKSGEIKNIHLGKRKRNNYGEVYQMRCFVCFAEPESAAIVLQKSVHAINRTRIYVEASPSWFQPDCKRIIAQLSKRFPDTNTNVTDDSIACSGSSSVVEDTFPLIFTLNDNCLEHICKLLPLDDQFNFALTCQRFYEIFQLLSKINFAHINTYKIKNWTPWQVGIRLQIVGPQIKHLDIDGLQNKSKWVKFLSRFCTNTEKLTVRQLEKRDIHTLINRMPLLKELQLSDFDLNDSLINSLKNLTNFRNLKTLEIIGYSYSISGIYLQLLSGLEKLSINGCFSLQSRYFRKICKNLKSLRYLDIRNYVLNTTDIERMLKHLQELETLKFSTTYDNFNGIAKLPKLKSLEINDHSKVSVTEEFLKILVEHQAEQLEELRLIDMKNMNKQKASLVAKLTKLKILHFITDATDDEILKKFTKLSNLEEVNFKGCDVSDDGVLNLLKYCLKLKILIFDQCDNISPKFVHEAEKLLQDQRSSWQRTDQVRVFFYGLKYKKDFPSNISEMLKVTCLFDLYLI